jgi:hypothetical protein
VSAPMWCQVGARASEFLSRVSRVPENDSGRISINVYGLVPTVPSVPSQKHRRQGRSVMSRQKARVLSPAVRGVECSIAKHCARV